MAKLEQVTAGRCSALQKSQDWELPREWSSPELRAELFSNLGSVSRSQCVGLAENRFTGTPKKL